ncbi:putative tetratricopeptide-like helical domain, pentacotripeptide-repeat region of PRORP [Lupinus albus]|uniref:Putative tetratricopeptide-like helical domain, pentacotripeptide-repeat region of PRORP n=1 Tax=Lupinus albus TaxID=3870 RepID=A0A6A4R2R9_LUPAL|nr:putative tetratricopeptide-like helical domain, pentacotripeptide-repeat region of PRORP [Lupinus albus]
MEVILCTNHLRHTSSFSFSFSTSFPPTQFLGSSTHTLRPKPKPKPKPLRSPNSSNNNFHHLFRFHSPRFLFKPSSFHSHPTIILFIVVTISAVSFIHYTLTNKNKNNNNSTQLRPHPHFALSPQFQTDNSLTEQQDEIKDLPFLNSSSSSSSSSAAVSVASVNDDDSNVFTVTDTFLPLPFKSTSLSDPDLPFTLIQFEENAAAAAAASSVTQNDALDEEHSEEKIELGSISNGFLFGESVREDLYMFYEANKKPANGTISSPGSWKPLSPNASFVNGNGFPSEIGNVTLKEHVEGVVPNSNYIGGYPAQGGSNNSRNGSRYLRNRERNYLDHNTNNVLPQNGHSIRVQAHQKNDRTKVYDDQKNDISEYLSKYNNLLKVGRLRECVELLKDTEKKGLLDMTKVYHAKFFNTCKRQKAVKEAFDYIRLIPNPTLSTFNMLMSVCTSSQDSERAFQVLQLLKEARLEPDCQLYTTLISTCAKSGKVDQMFEVFHKMVNSGVEPNILTYGALIDGCARVGQVAKAFGVYGIMRSKNVKPDRVVFNALIAACAQSGAVDRAFDVLAEMAAEIQPIDPDHITFGALMKACSKAGQVERAQDVYKMIQKYNVKGSPELYTIAINSCSQSGDWELAQSVYIDMTQKGVLPDEMLLSALIDVAGHAKKLDAAFEVLQEAHKGGIHVGIMSYSSLMGACSNTRNWQKALELYDYIKSLKLVPTVSTVNALLTALCDGDQFQRALEILSEMKGLGLRPNSITYSLLIVASEKNDDMEAAQMLLSQAKKDGASPNLVMCRCLIGMCRRRFEKACFVGEPVLSFDSGRPQVDSKWTSLALMVYRETIGAGEKPTSEILSQMLGCLQFPCEESIKNRLVENLGVSAETSENSNICSLMDGFGEYDSRALSILEEAASYGVVPSVSFKVSPIVVDAKEMHPFIAEVYLLSVLKGLKNRLAAGARLPNTIILLPIEKTGVLLPKGKKIINLSGRVGQAVGALLRRLQIPYKGNESSGKLRINGLALKIWFQPKLASPFSGKPGDWSSSQSRLGKSISHQQRNIRTGNLSLD